MTVSTTYARDPQADDIIAEAMHSLGVLNAAQEPDAPQKALGRKFLWSELQSLQNRGVILRARELYTQSITAVSSSTPYVVAPADTIDIEHGATVRTNTSAPADYPMQLTTEPEYQERSLKTQTGQPSEYWAQKQSDNSVRIYLYPLPTSDYVSITYPRIRKLRDVDTGSVTLDIPTKFHAAVVLKIAMRFALHFGLDGKAAMLKDMFDEEVDRAMGDETERGGFRFVVNPIFQRSGF